MTWKPLQTLACWLAIFQWKFCFDVLRTSTQTSSNDSLNEITSSDQPIALYENDDVLSFSSDASRCTGWDLWDCNSENQIVRPCFPTESTTKHTSEFEAPSKTPIESTAEKSVVLRPWTCTIPPGPQERCPSNSLRSGFVPSSVGEFWHQRSGRWDCSLLRAGAPLRSRCCRQCDKLRKILNTQSYVERTISLQTQPSLMLLQLWRKDCQANLQCSTPRLRNLRHSNSSGGWWCSPEMCLSPFRWLDATLAKSDNRLDVLSCQSMLTKVCHTNLNRGSGLTSIASSSKVSRGTGDLRISTCRWFWNTNWGTRCKNDLRSCLKKTGLEGTTGSDGRCDPFSLDGTTGSGASCDPFPPGGVAGLGGRFDPGPNGAHTPSSVSSFPSESQSRPQSLPPLSPDRPP